MQDFDLSLEEQGLIHEPSSYWDDMYDDMADEQDQRDFYNV